MSHPTDDWFDTARARADWNFAAESYDGFQQAGHDYYRLAFFGPAHLALCGEVVDLDALDLGCGNGYFTRELARRGARVAGIDLSERQIELALVHEKQEPLGINYAVVDAERIADQFAGESFDLVTACVSLGDMRDPGAAIRGAFAVLRPGGRLAASITHPCTDVPLREWDRDERGEKRALSIGRYFEGAIMSFHWRGPRYPYEFNTTSRHFTLAQWLNWFIEAGFVLTRFEEPMPTPAAVAAYRDLIDATLIPEFLLIAAQKP